MRQRNIFECSSIGSTTAAALTEKLDNHLPDISSMLHGELFSIKKCESETEDVESHG